MIKALLLACLIPCVVWGEQEENPILHEKFNRIVVAIYKIEGSDKAQYLYGIRSVKYKDEAEAKAICYRTVRNSYYRWIKVGVKESFLDHLARRYCPVNCDNDRGTNKFWLKNLKFYLDKK